jgi:hypothetical protein
MLITRREDKLVLVTQPDHAETAGEMVAHWGNDRFAVPPRHESARLAAAMHDDGWREADAVPLFNEDEHRPLHFLEIPMEEHIPLYGRGVDRTFERDPYAGLLVSMHWTGLYRARWGLQEGKLQWSAPVERLQDEAVEREERRWIDVKQQLVDGQPRSELEAGLWHTYDLLQAWDLLSLYVCLIDLSPADDVPARPVPSTLKGIDQQPGVRTIQSVPLRVGGDRVELTLRAVDPGVVIVDPYPFDEDDVEFSVPATAIPDRHYADADEVRQALEDGDERTITCRMRRA